MEPANSSLKDASAAGASSSEPDGDPAAAAGGGGGQFTLQPSTTLDLQRFNDYVDTVAAQAAALDGLDGKPISAEDIGDIARRTARSIQWVPPWRASGVLAAGGNGARVGAGSLPAVRSGPVDQVSQILQPVSISPWGLANDVGATGGSDTSDGVDLAPGAFDGADAPVGGPPGTGPLLPPASLGSPPDAETASADEAAVPQLVTAAQLRRIMPAAGKQADIFVGPINAALVEQNITNPLEIAAFIGQVAVECNQLLWMEEHLGYRVSTILSKFKREFPTKQSAQPFEFQPEKLANRAYAGKIHNGDEASGDGWRFRGRGLIQVTGRGNYASQGFESDPDALLDPMTAARTSVGYWRKQGLSAMTQRLLNSTQYYGVTGKVNTGHVDWAKRYAFYRRAVAVLAPEALKGVAKGSGRPAGGKRTRGR